MSNLDTVTAENSLTGMHSLNIAVHVLLIHFYSDARQEIS
jgi:hypothetical protein